MMTHISFDGKWSLFKLDGFRASNVAGDRLYSTYQNLERSINSN